MNEHRWNTQEFIDRTAKLSRTELHNLYPSEAWALYRVLPKVSNVLDLGCGNGMVHIFLEKHYKQVIIVIERQDSRKDYKKF